MQSMPGAQDAGNRAVSAGGDDAARRPDRPLTKRTDELPTLNPGARTVFRKLIIQIPCLDEEATIGATLAALPRSVPGFEVVEWLIVDDGSRDATVSLARRAGVDHVVSLPHNQGLARAFMAGLEASLKAGADVIVNTDADNQYSADSIPDLVAPIVDGRAQIVVGARPIAENNEFSFTKKILQRIGSAVVRVASGTRIADAPSGFRAIHASAALRLNVFGDYTYTLETIIQAGPERHSDHVRPGQRQSGDPPFTSSQEHPFLRLSVDVEHRPCVRALQAAQVLLPDRHAAAPAGRRAGPKVSVPLPSRRRSRPYPVLDPCSDPDRDCDDRVCCGRAFGPDSRQPRAFRRNTDAPATRGNRPVQAAKSRVSFPRSALVSRLVKVSGSGARSILSNATYLVGSQLTTTLARGVYVVLLARALGPEDFGIFNYALAWYLLFISLTYLGLDAWLVQKVATDRASAPLALRQTLVLRAAAALLMALGSCLLAGLIEARANVWLLNAIFAIALFGRASGYGPCRRSPRTNARNLRCAGMRCFGR